MVSVITDDRSPRSSFAVRSGIPNPIGTSRASGGIVSVRQGGARSGYASNLDELGAGRTIEQLLEAHPRLTREGVLAAVRFGAEVLRADVAYPVSKSVA
jgi:hypothetical protein